jgi:hypothetical protein
MRFEYACIISAAADTGEPLAVFRPEVEILVHGPNGSKVLQALVDTGSDNTVFPAYVARELGIRVQSATGPAAEAFGGHQVALSYADIELELIHVEGNVRWTAQAFFLVEESDEETVIVGRDGFLEYFTATFIGDEFALELKPNAFLPANGHVL